MIIEKKGIKIAELTPEELRCAYEEYRMECYKEDVRSKIEENYSDVFSEDELDNDGLISYLAEMFDRSLSKNESYYDAFWASMESVIDEYIKNNK